MKYFDLIQDTLFEIKRKIIGIEEIRKLVYYDTSDALTLESPTILQADNKIQVTAVFDITEPPYEHNTFVTIVASKILSEDEQNIFNSIIRVNIITQAQLWEIGSGNNKKIRPVEIANQIVTLLDNYKATASHKLYFHSMELIVLDGNINGYGLMFHLLEGSGLDDEF